MVSPRTVYKATYVIVLLTLFPIAIFRLSQVTHSLQYFRWAVQHDSSSSTAPVYITDEFFLPLEFISLALLFTGLVLYIIRSNKPPKHLYPTLSANEPISDQNAKWWRSYRRMGIDQPNLMTFRLGRGLVVTGASFLLSCGLTRAFFELFFTPLMPNHKTEYVLTYTLVGLEFFLPSVLYAVLFHNDPARVPQTSPSTFSPLPYYDSGDFLGGAAQYLPPTHFGPASSGVMNHYPVSEAPTSPGQRSHQQGTLRQEPGYQRVGSSASLNLNGGMRLRESGSSSSLTNANGLIGNHVQTHPNGNNGGNYNSNYGNGGEQDLRHGTVGTAPGVTGTQAQSTPVVPLSSPHSTLQQSHSAHLSHSQQLQQQQQQQGSGGFSQHPSPQFFQGVGATPQQTATQPRSYKVSKTISQTTNSYHDGIMP